MNANYLHHIDILRLATAIIVHWRSFPIRFEIPHDSLIETQWLNVLLNLGTWSVYMSSHGCNKMWEMTPSLSPISHRPGWLLGAVVLHAEDTESMLKVARRFWAY